MNSYKEQVLEILSENNSDCISGSKIANELNISRNMVWKYIKLLNDEGNIIKSSRKGYCLVSKKTAFSVYEIKKHLKIPDFQFKIFESVSSTNTILRKMAEEGAEEKTVVIAKSQTEGRGRRGRSFYSPDDSGIYMSILLRPDIKISNAILVTTCAAVAVCRAIESVCNKKAEIKWVNDIYIDGKKVCGILTEAAVNVESGKPEYVILGIGINLAKPKNDFPDEIKSIATALFEDEIEAENCKNLVVAGVLNFFFEEYSALTQKRFFNEYKNRMFLLYKHIKVLSSEEYDAQVIDLDEDFSLVVKNQSGEVKKLNSGEVSTRAY